MAEQISDALVGRMVVLVRDLHADHLTCNMQDRVQDFVARTAAIVAELPKSVDPDLIEAREVAAACLDCPGQSVTYLKLIRSGTNDHYSEVRIALAAIKRGRELALGASK